MTTIIGRPRRALAWCKRPREDFLAGAGLARQQHGGIRGGDRLDLLEHAPRRQGSRPRPTTTRGPCAARPRAVVPLPRSRAALSASGPRGAPLRSFRAPACEPGYSRRLRQSAAAARGSTRLHQRSPEQHGKREQADELSMEDQRDGNPRLRTETPARLRDPRPGGPPRDRTTRSRPPSGVPLPRESVRRQRTASGRGGDGESLDHTTRYLKSSPSRCHMALRSNPSSIASRRWLSTICSSTGLSEALTKPATISATTRSKALRSTSHPLQRLPLGRVYDRTQDHGLSLELGPQQPDVDRESSAVPAPAAQHQRRRRVARRLLVPERRDTCRVAALKDLRHQRVEGCATQFAGRVAEHLFEHRVGEQDRALWIEHQEAGRGRRRRQFEQVGHRHAASIIRTAVAAVSEMSEALRTGRERAKPGVRWNQSMGGCNISLFNELHAITPLQPPVAPSVLRSREGYRT